MFVIQLAATFKILSVFDFIYKQNKRIPSITIQVPIASEIVPNFILSILVQLLDKVENQRQRSEGYIFTRSWCTVF